MGHAAIRGAVQDHRVAMAQTHEAVVIGTQKVLDAAGEAMRRGAVAEIGVADKAAAGDGATHLKDCLVVPLAESPARSFDPTT
jgi:hypothetical protein